MNVTLNELELEYGYPIREDIFYRIGEACGYYVIPGTAAVGFVLNLICCIILSNPNLKEKSYKFLMCKSIIGTLMGLITIGFLNLGCSFCKDNLLSSYFVQFFKLYFIRHLGGILYLLESAVEILLSLNRYFIINKKNTINQLINITPVKYSFAFLTLLSAALWIPNYLKYEIIYVKEYDKYAFVATSYGNSKFYTYYRVTIYSFVLISNILGLNLINLLTLIKYKKFIRNKIRQTNDATQKQKLNKSDIAFTNMICCVTLNFSIVRLYSFVTLIIDRIQADKKVYFSVAANLSGNLSYWLLTVNYSLNVILFLALNKNREIKLSNIKCRRSNN